MSWTVLYHDGRLAVPAAPPSALPGTPPAGTRVVSFRPPPDGRPHDRREVNGSSRLLDLGADHVTALGLESDSSLAPLLLWDIAHALPVGGSVTLAGDGTGVAYLARGYFRDNGLTADPAGTTFRKTAPLPAERDRGLDRWTFGIPTGPGDATGLNAVVKRILELGIPESEVVLCGKPGANFRYLDKVRVVGEDIVGVPVPIAAKKNRLADEAKYENLCILHDRVFLPKDFLAAVRRFGDLYPVAGFQSLWFDDPYNLLPKRYSDYNQLISGWALPVQPGDAGLDVGYQQDLFSTYGGSQFAYAHPLRYRPGNYLTGSLYLCKRAVWQAVPQNARLKWQEFEDVEFGVRGDALGVPHRLNPFAFTQTIFARAGCLHPEVVFEDPSGQMRTTVSPLEAVKFRRKPLLRLSWAEAAARRAEFARKWVPRVARHADRDRLLGPPAGDTLGWATQVAATVRAAAIGFGVANARRFVADWQKLLLCDSLDLGAERHAVERLAACDWYGRAFLAEASPHLGNILFYRPTANLFYHSQAEFFPEDDRWLDRGTRLTARRLAKHGGAIIYHPDGRAGYEAAIRNSTPTRGYYDEGPR